ncbi:MAG: hypothetical protein ACLP9L_22230 [Thermoguttaceae bacterium]
MSLRCALRERLRECCPPPAAEQPPPPDAMQLLNRWRLSRLVGDVMNEHHAIAQLRELAERPRKRADRVRASHDPV